MRLPTQPTPRMGRVALSALQPVTLGGGLVKYRVRSVESVPHLKRRVTPQAPPSDAEPTPVPHTASWGRPTPADAAAMRGVPVVGPGIGGGAIRGTQPGQRLR
jgi:hypothetical protein